MSRAVHGPKGLAPWHTWGRAIQTSVTASALTIFQGVSVNGLVNVVYKRPETWRFFLWASLDNFTPAAAGAVRIQFNINTGVGQHFFAINKAATLLLPVAAGIGSEAWTNQLVTNGQVLADGVTSFQGFQDSIVGQAIIVGATVYPQGLTLADTATVTVGAFFSPNVHVRPEWWNGIFKAGED